MGVREPGSGLVVAAFPSNYEVGSLIPQAAPFLELLTKNRRGMGWPRAEQQCAPICSLYCNGRLKREIGYATYAPRPGNQQISPIQYRMQWKMAGTISGITRNKRISH